MSFYGDTKTYTNLGIRAECCNDGIVICIFEIDKCRLQSLVHFGDFRHVAESAAVNVVNAEQVSVRTEGLQDSSCRCGSRRESEGLCAPCLDGCKSLLKCITVWVA